MQNNGNIKSFREREDFFFIYPNGSGGHIKVIDCQRLFPRVRNILEEVGCDIKCVRNYKDILKHCSYCYGFYFDQKDSKALHGFKRIPKDEKDAFLLALRKLRAFSPPIPHYIWNNFGLNELTGGFCKLCRSGSRLGDTKRKNQIEEGNFDCFGRGLEFCSQDKCTYLEECLAKREEYYLWLRRVEFLKEMNQYDFKIIYR